MTKHRSASAQILGSGGVSPRNRFFKENSWIAGLQHFQIQSQIAYPSHCHNETSIVICTGGSLEGVQMGIREVLQPGDIVITNRNVIHSSRYGIHGEISEGLALDLDTTTYLSTLGSLSLNLPVSLESCIFLGKIRLPVLAEIGKDLIQAVEQQPSVTAFEVNALMQKIIAGIFRAWPSVSIRPRAHKAEPRLRRWDFIRAVQLMTAIDRDQFSVKFLSEEFDVATSTFNKLFRNTTGSTTLHVFHRILVYKACRILEDPDVSTKEVAYSLRFGSVSHFCALFKRFTGVSPKAFRAKMAAMPSETVLS